MTAQTCSSNGTFAWTTDNRDVVEIDGSGSQVTLKGLTIGIATVSVQYVDTTGRTLSAMVVVKVIYPIVLIHGFNSTSVGAWDSLSSVLKNQLGLIQGDDNCNASQGDVEFVLLTSAMNSPTAVDERSGGSYVQSNGICPYGGTLPQWGSFSSFIDEGFALNQMIKICAPLQEPKK